MRQEEPPEETLLKRPTASAFGEDGRLWRRNMPKGGWEYKAFSAPAQHHPPYLVLVLREKAYPCPKYVHLEHIEFDAGGTWVLLIFSSEIVNIKGSNLYSLVEGLLDEHVATVTQFDPARYKPVLGDGPIVTEIDHYVTRPASEGDVRALNSRIARLERRLDKIASQEDA